MKTTYWCKYPYNWYTVQEITIVSVGDEENSLFKKWFNDRLKEYPFLKKQNMHIQEYHSDLKWYWKKQDEQNTRKKITTKQSHAPKISVKLINQTVTSIIPSTTENLKILNSNTTTQAI